MIIHEPIYNCESDMDVLFTNLLYNDIFEYPGVVLLHYETLPPTFGHFLYKISHE